MYHLDIVHPLASITNLIPRFYIQNLKFNKGFFVCLLNEAFKLLTKIREQYCLWSQAGLDNKSVILLLEPDAVVGQQVAAALLHSGGRLLPPLPLPQGRPSRQPRPSHSSGAVQLLYHSAALVDSPVLLSAQVQFNFLLFGRPGGRPLPSHCSGAIQLFTIRPPWWTAPSFSLFRCSSAFYHSAALVYCPVLLIVQVHSSTFTPFGRSIN